ncbi:hypothetical protein CROQUDRAFT_664948 [Cronartium quercuum f. sp. fusiforme G11]|uniref:Mitotic checkpoint protein BUB3 n=1 Tax=Cronartium quercuum f. sp. fusiforme G11 TaxID=708437 RepID=A0A9P6N6R0_9BASI|nr:hypothetical protein CROQUDRAFT_664948 [Cronartium quercuum f. sp. fusiforme G11]
MTSKEFELATPEDAVSALKFHSSQPDLLLSSSWDKTVKLYNLASENPSEPVSVYPHPSPILDVSFGAGKNEGKAFTGSLDRGIREIDLETGTATASLPGILTRPTRVIATHQDAVKCVHYAPEHDILVTGSWDRSVILQDPRITSQKQYPNQITSLTLPNLPSKVYSLDTSADKLVVAMGNRRIWVWDLRKLSEAVEKVNEFSQNGIIGEPVMPPPPLQERESSLKFMTRSIRCMPNGQGYTSTSIEGRVAVEFFDTSPEVQAKKYAFKSHRQTIDGVDTIYPVNALAFHPKFGTFATGGGDSMVSIWDSAAKKRLRQLPKYPASVSTLAFNCDGTRLAIGCSLLEEEGTAPKPTENGTEAENKSTEGTNPPRNAIFIRNVTDDCKPKSK